jgi:hypothetical protein
MIVASPIASSPEKIPPIKNSITSFLWISLGGPSKKRVHGSPPHHRPLLVISVEQASASGPEENVTTATQAPETEIEGR